MVVRPRGTIVALATLSRRDQIESGGRVLAFWRARRAGDLDGLIEALRYPETRLFAVRYLGKLGDERAIPFIARLIRAGDAQARCNAADALRKLGAREYVDDLVALAESDPDPMVRSWAISAASDLGAARALASFRKMLDHDDPRVRRAVAYYLGHHGTAHDIPGILRATKADRWMFRSIYRKAIGEIRRGARESR